jgi:superoxide dismutase
LNKALAGSKYEKKSLEELMLMASRTGDAIRNNVGGHYNHTLFWNVLGVNQPWNSEMPVAKAITQQWGGLDSLKKMMNQGAMTRFGSGWVWLVVTPEKKLLVCSSANQDNPIMDVMKERGIPILGIDVWEHAYYLKYQNKRNDYLGSIWNVINWVEVDKNYQKALNDPFLKTIEKDAWVELKDFHKVMAQTFHPAEEGNFDPIRLRATEMVLNGETLKNGKLPASYDSPTIRKALDELVKQAKVVQELVSKSNTKNEKIMAELTKVHDAFHVVEGLCKEE